MKRSKTCKWCKKTDALVPIVQGGPVHTMCPECGTNGPVLEFGDLRKSYLELLSKNKRLENIAELATKVIDYHEGNGKYNFSHLDGWDRYHATGDAWDEIYQALRSALKETEATQKPKDNTATKPKKA